jgi:hypothetical protein
MGGKSAYKILAKILKGRVHSEGLYVDGNIMLEWTLRRYVNRMHLTQDRDQWRVLMSTLINIRVP